MSTTNNPHSHPPPYFNAPNPNRDTNPQEPQPHLFAVHKIFVRKSQPMPIGNSNRNNQVTTDNKPAVNVTTIYVCHTQEQAERVLEEEITAGESTLVDLSDVSDELDWREASDEEGVRWKWAVEVQKVDVDRRDVGMTGNGSGGAEGGNQGSQAQGGNQGASVTWQWGGGW